MARWDKEMGILALVWWPSCPYGARPIQHFVERLQGPLTYKVLHGGREK